MELEGVLQVGTALWKHVLKEREGKETQDEERWTVGKDRAKTYGKDSINITIAHIT